MGLWCEVQAVGKGKRLGLFIGDQALRQKDYLQLLAADEGFPDWYTAQLLLACGAEAFFWEHPCMSLATADDPAELVLIDAPVLAGVQADPTPFAEHFQAGESVCRFASLGGDAELIAPAPLPAGPAYPHLAAFLRSAPPDRRRALWATTARTVQGILTHRPLWLSTSGLGVYWLHVRVDERPKYYQHRAYVQAGE